MTAGRFCCVCDRPITGESRRIPRESASGARPDDYAHLAGDPDCQPPSKASAPRALRTRPPARRRP